MSNPITSAIVKKNDQYIKNPESIHNFKIFMIQIPEHCLYIFFRSSSVSLDANSK